MALVEIVLVGADYGLWGHSGWRARAYYNGAFWRQLLQNWPSNYPGQSGIMFVTHGILHAGPVHVAMNGLTLLSIGPPLLERVGRLGFIKVYVLSQFAGAAAFAILFSGAAPMVGASGALFGIAGALLYESWRTGGGFREVWCPVIFLVALNVVMFVALDGRLSWQAHLGGAIGGVVAMRHIMKNAAKAGV